MPRRQRLHVDYGTAHLHHLRSPLTTHLLDHGSRPHNRFRHGGPPLDVSGRGHAARGFHIPPAHSPAAILDNAQRHRVVRALSATRAARTFQVTGRGGVALERDGCDRQPDRDRPDQQGHCSSVRTRSTTSRQALDSQLPGRDEREPRSDGWPGCRRHLRSPSSLPAGPTTHVLFDVAATSRPTRAAPPTIR